MGIKEGGFNRRFYLYAFVMLLCLLSAACSSGTDLEQTGALSFDNIPIHPDLAVYNGDLRNELIEQNRIAVADWQSTLLQGYSFDREFVITLDGVRTYHDPRSPEPTRRVDQDPTRPPSGGTGWIPVPTSTPYPVPVGWNEIWDFYNFHLDVKQHFAERTEVHRWGLGPSLYVPKDIAHAAGCVSAAAAAWHYVSDQTIILLVVSHCDWASNNNATSLSPTYRSYFTTAIYTVPNVQLFANE
jgi:hypothetical protein